MLLDAGADVLESRQDSLILKSFFQWDQGIIDYGLNPMENAILFARIDVLEAFRQRNVIPKTDDWMTEKLHQAVQGCRVNVVRAFCVSGYDISARNEYGWTAVHFAAVTDNVEMFIILINAGADFLSECERGKTPLSLARRNGHTGAIKALMAAGARGESWRN